MRNKPWNDQENKLLADFYVAGCVAQYKGNKFIKAHAVKAIVEATGRTRGSVEAKAMNYSASAVKQGLCAWLPNGYMKGYKPAPNYQASIDETIRAAFAQSYDIAVIINGEVEAA